MVAVLRDITSVGSPGYTPLEHINGRAVPQSDFYALGRSLVHLLTGQHPIDLPEDDTTGRLIWQDQTSVETWFAQLLDDMMAPFPGQRPLNGEVLLARLTNPQLSPTKRIQPLGQLLLLANIGLLLLQLFVGWQWWLARQRLAEPTLNRRQVDRAACCPRPFVKFLTRLHIARLKAEK
mgnify:CR=1 FL=1